MKKSKKVIIEYKAKRQLLGGYKVIEIYRYSNEEGVRRRILFKNLSLSTAESVVYNLESRNKL